MAGVFHEAIKAWGIEAQSDMCSEECAELIQAISKIKRIKFIKFNDPDRLMIKQKRLKNLKKELADVQIMINQLSTVYDFSEELEAGIQALKEKIKKSQSKEIEASILCPVCKAAELTKLPQCRCPAEHWACPMCGRRYVKWFDNPMQLEREDAIKDVVTMSSARKLLELRK